MWYNVEVQGMASVEAESEEDAQCKVEMGNYYNLDLTVVSVEPEYGNYGEDGPID